MRDLYRLVRNHSKNIAGTTAGDEKEKENNKENKIENNKEKENGRENNRGKEIDLLYLNARYISKEEQQIISSVIMGEDKRYQEDEKKLYKMLTDTVKHLNNRYIEEQVKLAPDASEIQKLLSKKNDLGKLNIAVING